jgi:taurine transport system permease protein
MSSLDLPVAGKHVTPNLPAAKPAALSTRWISTLTLASLLLAWWLVTAAGWIEPLFLPPPADILAKAGPAHPGYMDASLWQHLGASLAASAWPWWLRP